jgi:hypothetical protein
MTTRRKKVTTDDSTETVSLSQLLSPDSDSSRITYGDLDGNTLARLGHVITEVGGFATYWLDSDNSRICLSVRLGAEKKSYNFEAPEEFKRVAEDIIGKLTPALQRMGRKPPPPIK